MWHSATPFFCGSWLSCMWFLIGNPCWCNPLCRCLTWIFQFRYVSVALLSCVPPWSFQNTVSLSISNKTRLIVEYGSSSTRISDPQIMRHGWIALYQVSLPYGLWTLVYVITVDWMMQPGMDLSLYWVFWISLVLSMPLLFYFLRKDACCTCWYYALVWSFRNYYRFGQYLHRAKVEVPIPKMVGEEFNL